MKNWKLGEICVHEHLGRSCELCALSEDVASLKVACQALLRLIDGLPWHTRDAVYKAFNERTGGLPGSLPEPIAKARELVRSL